ncbi:hypothetical protein F5146DRAFT_1005884 [Armillaria mellea]|nr:hypothetical protein F5146DRAFT_1005884 [Armillaria mellea]
MDGDRTATKPLGSQDSRSAFFSKTKRPFIFFAIDNREGGRRHDEVGTLDDNTSYCSKQHIMVIPRLLPVSHSTLQVSSIVVNSWTFIYRQGGDKCTAMVQDDATTRESPTTASVMHQMHQNDGMLMSQITTYERKMPFLGWVTHWRTPMLGRRGMQQEDDTLSATGAFQAPGITLTLLLQLRDFEPTPLDNAAFDVGGQRSVARWYSHR